MGRVALGRRESVALDRADAEPGALVEAQVVECLAAAVATTSIERRCSRTRSIAALIKVRPTPRPRNDGSTAMFLISLCCASWASTSCRCPTTRSPANATSTCPESRYESSCAGESSAIANSLRSSPRGPPWSWTCTPAGSNRASPLPGVQCDQGRIPASTRGGSSSIVRYSRRCPSGSRKYTAAAGIQPMTLGSVVSAAKNESGVTPRVRRRSHAPSTSSSEALKATCNDNAMGADPSDQRPSIASPGSPIQKNAAPRSGASSASDRPTTSV